MSQSKFPEGWSEEKVRRILAHYQEQTEDEALAEDEQNHRRTTYGWAGVAGLSVLTVALLGLLVRSFW